MNTYEVELNDNEVITVEADSKDDAITAAGVIMIRRGELKLSEELDVKEVRQVP